MRSKAVLCAASQYRLASAGNHTTAPKREWESTMLEGVQSPQVLRLQPCAGTAPVHLVLRSGRVSTRRRARTGGGG